MAASGGRQGITIRGDALDECDSQSLQSFLRLLAKAVPGLNKKVKWILTSRNEPQITEELRRARHSCDTSLELNSSHVAGAVKQFIASRVNDLATLKNYVDLYGYRKDVFSKTEGATAVWGTPLVESRDTAPNRASGDKGAYRTR